MDEALAADGFEALELGERVGVVVDAKVERRVFLGGVDDERGGLLAALVAAGGFAGFHCGDEAAGKGRVADSS